MRSRGAWTRQLPVVTEQLEIASPVTIGVVADTHASPTRELVAVEKIASLFERFGVGLILHAGDVGHRSVLERLGHVAPVFAVRGNADPVDLREALPDRLAIAAGSRTILLLHGHHGKTARIEAKSAASPELDLVVYGHSHRPLIEREGETILFNPGSAVERRWHPHFGVGLIEVSEQEVAPELVLFDDARHLDNVHP